MVEPSPARTSSATQSHAHAERAALAAALSDAGPDATTLCAGWTTRDLVGHLVAREWRPDSGLGLLIGRFADRTERIRTDMIARHSYDRLVEIFENRGPFWSPTGNPLTDRLVNAAEFFVHHEDVRRAKPDFRPRGIPAKFETYLWGRLKLAAPLLARNAPTGMLLSAGTGRTARIKRADVTVRLSGQPSELLLFCFGRQSVARVDLDGPTDAVTALKSATFTI